MASRLSEDSLKAVYDAGTQGLLIQNDQALSLLAPPAVDLDKLLDAEDAEAAVQAVPPQQMFEALVRRGPEDALEVLRLLSPDQVTRILDYDAWQEDRLAPMSVIRWLDLFKELGPEQLYTRFRELDEEYQVALLEPWIDLYDEDQYEKMGDAEQDQLHRLPCGTQFYRIKSEDPRVIHFVEDLVEASLGQDVNYAYALLSHAAYSPPAEAEDAIARFRRARIEEDGFVSYDESLLSFQPVDLAHLLARHAAARGAGGGADESALRVSPSAVEGPFLLAVIKVASQTWTQDQVAAVTQSFAFLGNSLCAAAKVGTDDVHGLRRVLEHGQALAGLGLEYLAGGDLQAALRILAREHPKTLFRTGITLAYQLAEAGLTRLALAGIPAADRALQLVKLGRPGAVLALLDTELLGVLGFDRVEALKGLCNRFPVHPVATQSEGGSAAARIVFKPLASLADLASLAARVDAITGLAHLGALAKDAPEAPIVDLDRQLATALARILAGGEFRDAPLSEAEATHVLALPQAAAQELAADFLSGVEGTLRTDLLAVDGGGWCASAATGLSLPDPTQSVLAELSDVMLRLAACRERSRHAGAETPAALAELAVLIDVVGHSPRRGGH